MRTGLATVAIVLLVGVLQAAQDSQIQREYTNRVLSMSDTAAAHVELAKWCQANGLAERALLHWGEAIARDADCAEARAALGYVRRDIEWVKAPVAPAAAASPDAPAGGSPTAGAKAAEVVAEVAEVPLPRILAEANQRIKALMDDQELTSAQRSAGIEKEVATLRQIVESQAWIMPCEVVDVAKAGGPGDWNWNWNITLRIPGLDGAVVTACVLLGESKALALKKGQKLHVQCALRLERSPREPLSLSVKSARLYEGQLPAAGAAAGAEVTFLGMKPQATFLGINAKKVRKIVYVVDRSGSMTDSIGFVRSELKRSIGELDEGQEFHVIFYSSGPPVEMPTGRLVNATTPTQPKQIPCRICKGSGTVQVRHVRQNPGFMSTPPVTIEERTCPGCKGSRLEHAAALSGTVEMPTGRLVNATNLNKELAFEFIDGVIAQGETDPSKALERAFSCNPDLILLLTDGQFDRAIIDLVKRLNVDGKVTVHTIGFLYKTGESVLKQIAEENHGNYKFVSEQDLGGTVPIFSDFPIRGTPRPDGHPVGPSRQW